MPDLPEATTVTVAAAAERPSGQPGAGQRVGRAGILVPDASPGVQPPRTGGYEGVD
jgi:hypothetical protein